MERQHAIYRVTLEALNQYLEKHFNIEGSIYYVNQNLERGIIEFHATGGKLPCVYEGGEAIDLPLDHTIQERINKHNNQFGHV